MLRILSTPALFALELTLQCNNRCSGCLNFFVEDRQGHRDLPVQPPLSFEQWCTLLDLLAPHAHRFKLTGGEPTLHPEFERIVSYLGGLGTSFTLFTNGRWRDPKGIVNLLASIPNLSGLLISLHGAHPASHVAFTSVPGSFEETVGNIAYATAAGIPVTLSTVLHCEDLNELAEIVALSKSLGADHIVFNRYLGPTLPRVSITNAQLMKAVHLVDALRRQGEPVSFGNCIPQCFAPSSSTGCLAGVAFCTVDPWGNLRPCNHSALIAGNLLNGTLEEAWHSPEMERFRQAIPQECHTCAAFGTCHGGCQALAMELNLPSDPLMRQPLAKFGPPPPIRMGRNWRPTRRFHVRQEPFGLVLIRGNALLAVHPAASTILERLDGTHTLGELEQAFEPAALQLIGELFRRNMLEITT